MDNATFIALFLCVAVTTLLTNGLLIFGACLYFGKVSRECSLAEQATARETMKANDEVLSRIEALSRATPPPPPASPYGLRGIKGGGKPGGGMTQ